MIVRKGKEYNGEGELVLLVHNTIRHRKIGITNSDQHLEQLAINIRSDKSKIN